MVKKHEFNKNKKIHISVLDKLSGTLYRQKLFYWNSVPGWEMIATCCFT